MQTTSDHYATRLDDLQRAMLRFLRAFEEAQQDVRPRRVRAVQSTLRAEGGDDFLSVAAEFPSLDPPDSVRELHSVVCDAASQLGAAYAGFIKEPDMRWTESFLVARRHFCLAQYLLYEHRRELKLLQPFWVMPEAAFDATEASGAARDDTGFIHSDVEGRRGEYTLYVPETYSPDRPAPLIVCMHGGYGEAFDYILTWLRAAKTRGYILLSPKSIGVTWTMHEHGADIESIRLMLEEVRADYVIDPARSYLTGLSDGGTFSYLIGLAMHQVFAGIAPIAAGLHFAVEPLLRLGIGKDVPLFAVHGAYDHIFPADLAHATKKLLDAIGYQMTYTELPDWGHAYTNRINETLVMPWFDGLVKKLPEAG